MVLKYIDLVTTHLLIFCTYGTFYFTLECIFNAIFTRPHNKSVNNIMQTENKGEDEHILNTVGFARLFMLPFSAVLGYLSFIPVIYISKELWWVYLIYVPSIGLLFTILEWLVGTLVFKWFKVRLWDYRNEPLTVEFTTIKHYGLWNTMSVVVLLLNLKFKGFF